MNPKQHVRHDDIVEVTFFLVLEEQVGLPDFLGLGEREKANAGLVVVLESIVEPLLAEGDLRGVLHGDIVDPADAADHEVHANDACTICGREHGKRAFG